MSDPRSGQSIFTRGAVDLGALATPRSASPAGAVEGDAAAGPAGVGGFMSVTEANFQQEVVDRSMTIPVVLEFVAGQQYAGDPALAKFAAEGTFVLVRSDIQVSPRLAQALRIQNLPTIFAFVGGQPIDGLPGQLPEAQLRQWIDAVLRAGGLEVEQPEDPRLTAADEALIMGDLDAAEKAYQKILADTPRDAAAEAGLAHVALAKRLVGVEFAAAIAAADADPADVPAQLLAADAEAYSGEAERAYARLIGLIRRVFGEEREKVRQHLVSLFAVAGPDDPAVATARRQLASALF
ncbi:tetratricopeptide repeat protein [Allocatelliglobosispora scoriae]|nr:tetratricopeptide repeat protein [Allocatelliglobosispora scoriae]